MCARWIAPHTSAGSKWRFGYADGSAHRIISDLSAFIGNVDPSSHRILAAGDLNTIYGVRDSPDWNTARDRSICRAGPIAEGRQPCPPLSDSFGSKPPVSLSRTPTDARPGSLRQQGAPRGGCSTVGPDRFIQAGFRFAHGAGRRDGGIDTTVAGDRGSLCKNLNSSVEVFNAGLDIEQGLYGGKAKRLSGIDSALPGASLLVAVPFRF